MTLDECRNFYSQEIRFIANPSTPGLLEAFARVPREHYLGPPPWQLGSPEQRAVYVAGRGSFSYVSTEDPRDLYHNVVVGLDPAHDVNNGQPTALARWIDALQLKPGDRAYHLGCGVGYYTAIIAEIVGPQGSVVGIELHSELAARAKQNLSGYANVTVHSGDGSTFDPDACDAMLINAGVTHPLPIWLERLRENGRLVVPLTVVVNPAVPLGQGIMSRILRTQGGYSAQMVSMVGIFSCAGARDAQLEPVMLKSLSTGALLKLKSIRRDAHQQEDSCLVHGSEVCISSSELAPNSAS